MTASGPLSSGVAVPVVPYEDVLGARDWLCAAFGFTPHDVVTAPDGSAVFAQVSCGDAVIVLSVARDGGGANTPTERCYVLVSDIDTHYGRAIEAGALLVAPLETSEQGRGYSCRDPAGNVWSFGTFDPRPSGHRPSVARYTPTTRWLMAGAAALALMVGSAVAGAGLYTTAWQDIEAALIASATAKQERDEANRARALAEGIAHDVKADLLIEQSAKAQSAAALEEAKADLRRERESIGRIEAALSAANEALAKEREANAAATKAAQDAEARLTQMQRVAGATERNMQAQFESLKREISAYREVANAKKDLEARFDAEKAGREAGQKASRATVAELARARDELQKASLALQEAQAKLKAERTKREAAEASLKNALAALKQRSAATPLEPPQPQPAVRGTAASGSDAKPVQGSAAP